jgi:hypothetical protein
MIVVDRSSPGFEGDPWLGRSSATLTAATASAAAATLGSSAGSRSWSSRRSDDNVSGAHVGDVGQIPDSLFTSLATEIHGAVRQFRGGLAQQRVSPPATAAATTAAATACSTFSTCSAFSRRGRLLAERNKSHCDEPESAGAKNKKPAK